MLLGMGNYAGMGATYDDYAKEGYAQNSVANACITKIANAIASVDLEAYTQDGEGNLIKQPNHGLKLLIDNPNQMKSGKAFRRDLVTQILVGGNAFVLDGSVGNSKKLPPSLFLLSPSNMKVNIGDKMPIAYEYRTAGNVTSYPVDALTGKSKVLHLKTPNPLNEWVGLAPMAAAAHAVDIFNSGMRWNKKLLDNDCRPAGALIVEGEGGKSAALTNEQYLRLKEQIEQQFSGASNAGKPLLLEGGLKWSSLSLNPKDMDYKENIMMAARFIASVFHVPPQLVNIPGESTYSNYEQAEMSFWADTVLPLLSAVLEDFNRWLSPLTNDGAFLWYDEDSIPALEPLRKIKAERINAASYMATNEKRYAMGLEKQAGGDEILVESNKIPLSLLDVNTNG